MSPETSLFLVLDDEQSIRQSIVSFLEDEGYTVLRADSTETAILLVETHPVDAAVVDIRLPGKDGNHFMREARKIRPEIRFVVHTGSADYAPPESIRALGVTRDRVLIKPVRDLGEILEALQR